ncbi:MAG: hypothetical protein IT193_11125 [Propionibacteriaceae bacterium]|nr:hypothetical protein [Propionibacteriaceae bacterium]
MSKARVMVAALATAGLLAFAGCGNSPQVAAYVGDFRVQQDTVEAVSQVLADASSDAYDTAGSFSPTVMQIMVQTKLAAQAGEAKGISVTEEQRQQIYAQNELYAGLLKNPVTTDFMTGYANTSVILGNEAALAAYKDLIASTPIRVNPRFGTWDPEAGGLVEGSSGSLSSVAPIKQG